MFATAPLLQVGDQHTMFTWKLDIKYMLLFSSFAGFHDNLNLTVNTDMVTIVKAMAQPDSGLEIRDRMWLKITIANAFIGKLTFGVP